MRREAIERRQSRITVDELRRDLRQADEQIYTLTAHRPATEAAPRRRKYPIILALIAMLPVAGALWAAMSDPAPAEPAAVGVDVAPVAATVVPEPQPEPPRPLVRSVRAAVRRTVPARRRVTDQPIAPVIPRKHLPRPLSPGEFGR